MPDTAFYERQRAALEDIRAQGLTKPERVLLSRQGVRVRLRGEDGREVEAINLCANNYLGLAGDPRIMAASVAATSAGGAGFASVRFICGTHEMHKELEEAIAGYLGFDDSILFAAAFDANGAVFEPLLDEQDAIVSDSLNHASIIDGIRLCKAKRYRFQNNDMDDLETQLKAARADGARTILIVTDGVFSMDGYLANLPAITDLAGRYQALVMVDDCHATGVVGPAGRGVAALQGVGDKIDIITGTFGKALGGAMGGFIVAKGEVIEILRQRARPYLFSNALAPSICGASLAAIEISRGAEGDGLRQRIAENAAHFRSRLTEAGFKLNPGQHPIIPVLLGDARLAQSMARELLDLGVFVTGFSYPVVPKGQARIRTQVSAAHTPADLDFAVEAFVKAREICGAAAQ